MEAIVQNTANTLALKSERSFVDKHPSRFNILGSANNREEIFKTSKEKYARDPEAYYPYVDTNKPVKESVEAPKMNRAPTHPTEKQAYYDPTGLFRRVPKPYIGKSIPVVMGELQNSFPTERNLKSLQTQLKAINVRENLDIEAVYQKGIYYSDPRAYYDPTTEDTESTVRQLQGSIRNMENNLNEGLKNNLEAKMGKIKYTPQIENQINKDSEERAIKVANNYYTPVENRNGVSVELPVGAQAGKNLKVERKPFPRGEKVSAEEITHTYEEAETVTPTNSNSKTDADSKETNSNKEASRASRSVKTSGNLRINSNTKVTEAKKKMLENVSKKK